jgi:hypothetical protein
METPEPSDPAAVRAEAEATGVVVRAVDAAQVFLARGGLARSGFLLRGCRSHSPLIRYRLPIQETPSHRLRRLHVLIARLWRPDAKPFQQLESVKVEGGSHWAAPALDSSDSPCVEDATSERGDHHSQADPQCELRARCVREGIDNEQKREDG